MTVRVNRWLAVLAIFTSLFMFSPGLASDTDALVNPEEIINTGDFVEGEILVGFRPGANAKAVGRARRALKANSEKNFHQIRVRHWKLPRGLSVEKAITILNKNPLVEFAEPNYIYSADVHPDDPQLSELWGMHNVGQTGGLDDADIDAVEAWDQRTDATNIIVGIIDTGIDYDHEDIAANMWMNPGESGDDEPNGVDNDENGYVDDIFGWDFVNNNNDPFDDNGHGTHVAGTIGAVGNNGVGVAGVFWSVKLMALKFLDENGRGVTDDAIEAILYAASMGVPITNYSWGGGKKSRALQSAIEHSNSLFVASAGNWNTSRTQYPAGYSLDNILSVAASDANDEKASFSNYSSKWVDLAAPGVDILSSMPGNTYDYKSGTSMAAPHVAGVAAMVMAENEGLFPTEVKAYIMESVDLLPAFNGITVSGGRLNALNAIGGDAPSSADVTPPAAVSDLSYILDSATYDTLGLEWIASADDGNDPDPPSGPAFHYDLRYRTDGEITSHNWDTATPVEGEPSPQAPGTPESMIVTGLSNGTKFHFAIKAIDEAGNSSDLSTNAMASTVTSPWFVGILNDIGPTGFWNSIALPPGSDDIAIAYSEDDTGDVHFVQWNGTGWDKVVASSSGKTGISLAFNPVTSNPAISHTWGALYFSKYEEGMWSTEIVDRKGAKINETSLAYDSAGFPCIAYRSVSGKTSDLKLACNYGSGWEIQYVQRDAAAAYISLAFDPDDNPAIAYSDDLDNDNRIDTLIYALWNGNSWDIDPVSPSIRSSGYSASLVFDPVTGNPMLADRADTVRFFYYDGIDWQMTQLEKGRDVNMAIYSSGTPYISYSISDPETVRVAHPVTPGDYVYDHWDIETVGSADVAGRTSIAIKTDGLPVLSYADWNDFNGYILRWAERLP